MSLFEFVISAVVSLLIAVPISYSRRLIVGRTRGKQSPSENFSARVSRLSDSLKKSSMEIDDALKQFEAAIRQRTTRISQLEKSLQVLSTMEKQAKDRIEKLKGVSIESIKHLEAYLQQGERRSAWRDYILFGSGVVVTTIITALFNFFGK